MFSWLVKTRELRTEMLVGSLHILCITLCVWMDQNYATNRLPMLFWESGDLENHCHVPFGIDPVPLKK